MWDGDLVTPATGEPVRFLEALRRAVKTLERAVPHPPFGHIFPRGKKAVTPGARVGRQFPLRLEPSRTSVSPGVSKANHAQ